MERPEEPRRQEVGAPGEKLERFRMLETTQGQPANTKRSTGAEDQVALHFHDLRNLLQITHSALIVLERGIARMNHRELDGALAQAKSSSGRAAALSQRLLDVATRQPRTLERLDVNAAIREVAVMFEIDLRENIDLTCKLADDLPHLQCDRMQFERALLNLATNARDAMPLGGRLTISARRRNQPPQSSEGGRPYVCISVADTGVGMSDATRERAQEPFYTTKIQGSGLGLASVKWFAEVQNGHVEIDSVAGSHTIVSLVLPGEDRL
jgi:signal transduction histidine kinase